jgi:hypothetical protein
LFIEQDINPQSTGATIMLYFLYVNGELNEVTTEYHREAINRNDWKSLEEAEKVAVEATALTERLHIATDSGPYCSPRYDVIEAPRVGDEVSKSFNGDSYPAGRISKISSSLRRVETDTGEVFWRHRESGSWIEGQTWSMIPGHISERNPSF